MGIEGTHIDAERGFRIDRFRSGGGRGAAGRSFPGHEIDAIRAIATAQCNDAALGVLGMLDAAIGRGEHRVLVGEWLDVLRDAVRCDRRDGDAATVYAAACAVRLAD